MDKLKKKLFSKKAKYNSRGSDSQRLTGAGSMLAAMAAATAGPLTNVVASVADLEPPVPRSRSNSKVSGSLPDTPNNSRMSSRRASKADDNSITLG